jgi:LPPG:FO 2-phospho-L-lactate transferase
VVLCPSNPWVSIDPILAIPGIRSAIEARPVVAVSPFIGGRAVKGPAAKMAAELAVDPSPQAVGAHYRGLVDGLVYDQADPDVGSALEQAGLRSLRTRTLMRSDRDRRRLAEEVVRFGAAVARVEVA